MDNSGGEIGSESMRFGVGPGPGRGDSAHHERCASHMRTMGGEPYPCDCGEAGALIGAGVKEGATETEDGASLRAFESLAARVRDAQAEVDRLEPVAILAARDLRKARDRLADAQRQLDRQRQRLDPPEAKEQDERVNKSLTAWWKIQRINTVTGHRNGCNTVRGEACDCDHADRMKADLLAEDHSRTRPAGEW